MIFTQHSLMGLGGTAINVLTYVKNPPGTLFLGYTEDGSAEFLVHLIEFGDAIGINSHHMTKVWTMFKNLLAGGQIKRLERTKDQLMMHSALVGLLPLAHHELTTCAEVVKMTTDATSARRTPNVTSQAATNFGAYLDKLYYSIASQHRNLDFSGFDSPDMWRGVSEVCKRFNEKGSAGLTDTECTFDWWDFYAGRPQRERIRRGRRGDGRKRSPTQAD